MSFFDYFLAIPVQVWWFLTSPMMVMVYALVLCMAGLCLVLGTLIGNTTGDPNPLPWWYILVGLLMFWVAFSLFFTAGTSSQGAYWSVT